VEVSIRWQRDLNLSITSENKDETGCCLPHGRMMEKLKTVVVDVKTGRTTWLG